MAERIPLIEIFKESDNNNAQLAEDDSNLPFQH
jgi:hypothetical protein